MKLGIEGDGMKHTKEQIDRQLSKTLKAFCVWNCSSGLEADEIRSLESKMILHLSQLAVKTGAWAKYLEERASKRGKKP